MDEIEKTVAALNDLNRINNDRVDGYEKAAAEATTQDIDLKTLFNRFAAESRKYANELKTQVIDMGGETAKGTTGSGKIYRVWMDVKATFTGKDRHSILSSCEFGEDAAQRAYDLALSSDADLEAGVRKIIVSQKESLKAAHDAIKNLRDINK